MKKLSILSAALSLVTPMLVVVSGCTIPLRVARVTDRNTATEGVRYLLKRPAYDVALRYLPKKAKLEQENGCDFEVIVSQSLTGPPIEFEAAGEIEVFADTEIELTQESDGALSAFTAGATDRSVEAFQTLASIVTSLVAPMGEDGPPGERPRLFPPCGDAELNAHRLEHRKLVRDVARARSAAQRQIDSVSDRSGSVKVRNIRELESLVATRERMLDEHVFTLHRGRAHVKIAGREAPLQGEGVKPWVIVTLKPVAP